MASFQKKIVTLLKTRWYIIVIVILLGGFYLYKQQTAKAAKEKASLYVIKRQDLQDTLTLSGDVEADEHVVLQFQSAGKVAWVGVKEGDTVKKYQTLATLDQRTVKDQLQKSLNTYLQTRNAFDQAASDNQRVGDQPTTDWAVGDKMKRLIQNAQAGLDNSVLDVEINNLALEYSNLVSPIDGIVTRMDVKYPGVSITIPSQSTIEVINPATLYFSFSADQTEIISIKKGMQGVITLDSYPDETIQGDVTYIAYTPMTNQTGTVYEARIKLNTTDVTKYKFGMTGDVTFVLAKKNNVVAIPSNYVLGDGGGKYVNKDVNGKLIKTYITVGKEIDSNYEILKGLAAGDSISIPALK